MIFAFFLSFIQSQDFLANDETRFSICITNKTIKKSYCPENVNETFLSTDKKFEKEFEAWLKKNHGNKFDGIDYLSLYIDYFDYQSKNPISLDIYSFKEAKHILVIGPNNESRSSFVLNVNQITTLDNFEMYNVIAVKDGTTQFFIKEMKIYGVRFQGFDKATVFYGYNLYSDLLSVSNTTFKFDTLYYNCYSAEKFYPNYDYDGSVFAKSIIMSGIQDGGSIFQYGSQFIITPISKEHGFRKTNFRNSTANNISYTIIHNSGNLYIGALFSNKASSFNNVSLKAINSYITIQEGEWNGDATISATLINSTLDVQTNDIQLKFTDDCQNSKVLMNKQLEIQHITSKSISQLEFNCNISIFEFEILENFTIVKISAKNSKISRLFSTKDIKEITLTGTPVNILQIYGQFQIIKTDSLVFTDKRMELIRDKYVPMISYTKPFEQKALFQIKSYSSFDPTDKYTLIEIPSDSTGTVDPFVPRYGFPLKFVEEISENKKRYSLTNITELFAICVSDDGKSFCGINSSLNVDFHDISSFLDSMRISQDLYKSIKLDFYLDTEVKFVVNPRYPLDIISVHGLRASNPVEIVALNQTMYYSFHNVSVDTPANQDSSTRLGFFNCTLTENFKTINFASLYIDAETYGKYFDHNLKFKSILKVYTDSLYFSKEVMVPDVPRLNWTNAVSLVGVRMVSGHGGFSIPCTMKIIPQPIINFTTNNYGNLKLILSPEEDVIVNFKAFFPADLDPTKKTAKINLVPNFWGQKLGTTRKFCSKYVNLQTQNKITVVLADEAFECSSFSETNSSARVIINNSYVSGVAHLKTIALARELHLSRGTYVDADTFGIPYDDFLVHVQVDLKDVPMLMIHTFTSRWTETYLPFFQVYPEFLYDLDKFADKKEYYKFGLPVLCIESSDYIGTLSTYGNIFEGDQFQTAASTFIVKYGVANEPDCCINVIPYEKPERQDPIIGPVKKGGWIGILVVSVVVLGAIITFLLISFICPRATINVKRNNVISFTE
ncbi:hypothetical protein TVAG_113560 [Trichomonas vaginalis G3]|uniref:Uncharacterized protein n=1 Tax=Trichomonas vaginalis (strain ATCC PRA-98 / G3) TaxID=412133 RepID=A2DNK9_TRIV3|nr:hypothetical protein TVAGG3_0608520 [Trichomonas vaginalis G3]EAY18012.1 hypothetical protein TVAG_113560 [Trichomonas vaginalis G3]KAI5524430.1 hypothetical protein TVAGG3_0608520 [Trichomonas vaginalis G3]|eukprot:XP_001578998.1 hypothetical protein [Trichomonas vaginalis G3]